MKLRHPAWRSIIVLSMTLAWIGCAREEAARAPDPAPTTPPSDGSARLVLDRFPAGRGVFELSMSPKTPEGYGFDITWQEEGKPPSAVAMPIFAATQQGERKAVSLDWGAESGQAWATGIESDHVATVARPIALDSSTTGLLVTQRYGFDHLKRWHRLLVPRQGKLESAWEFDEGQEPSWSSTIILPHEEGTPGRIALFVSRMGNAHPNQVYRINLTRYAWDPAQTKLIPSSPRANSEKTAVALLLGSFPTASSAYKYLREADSLCLTNYWVFSRNNIETLKYSRTALVNLFASRTEAEVEKKRLIECGISLPMTIVEF